MAVGIGASLSNAVAGAIVHRSGYAAGFLSLAGIAAFATAILWLAMPETRPAGSEVFLPMLPAREGAASA